MGHPLTLNEVYAHIHREGRRGIMTPVPSIKKSTLVSSMSRGGCGSSMDCGRGGRSTYSFDDRDRLKCEHCGCFRHTKDECWDLHGRPPDVAPRSSSHGGFSTGRGGGCLGGQRNSVHSIISPPTELPTMPPTSDEIGALSSDEIAALRHFVSQLDHSSLAPASSFANSGTCD